MLPERKPVTGIPEVDWKQIVCTSINVAFITVIICTVTTSFLCLSCVFADMEQTSCKNCALLISVRYRLMYTYKYIFLHFCASPLPGNTGGGVGD